MSDEDRNDNDLISIMCPHCKMAIPVQQVHDFYRSKVVFIRCSHCDGCIYSNQIDLTYKEYKN